MPHSRLIAAIPLVIALTAPVAALAQPVVPMAPYQTVDLPLITISAEGQVLGKPDMATLNSGVQTNAPTAKAAMSQNAAQMEKLVAALLNAGIDRKYIQTSSINLSPQYDYSSAREGQPPRFIGYQASNQINVEVRDLKRVGDLIDAMVGAGATNLNGPTFGIADPSPLLRQAREKALRTARERAEFYAAQSGYKSVRIVSINEQGGGYPMPVPMMAMAREAAAPATPVEPGQLATSAVLSVQYVMER